MLTVSALYIYPIKSLGGISVTQANLTDRGFEYDRNWMLVDAAGNFLTQRELPEMALLQCAIEGEKLVITHKINGDEFSLGLHDRLEEKTIVHVWGDACHVCYVSGQADSWFSQILGLNCRLVFMPKDSLRKVDADYAFKGEITSLSDGFPLLIIGQASLEDLNNRLEEKIEMDRFRPNIVFTGGEPYQEDEMTHFTINGIDLFGVKPCARCPIPTTNQQTAERGKEPLKTLSGYRMRNNKVYFGQNVLYDGRGVITVGDTILSV